MCFKMIMVKRRLWFWLGLVAVVLMAGPAEELGAQVQVGRGAGLDANRQVGSGGRNPMGSSAPGALGNQIISGNVGGGKGFRGPGAVGDFRSFQGSLGTSRLDSFQRDSYGISNNAASPVGAPRSFFPQSSTVLGIRDVMDGQAIPGSNMPSNVNLTPRPPSGPVLGPSGDLSRFAGAGPVDKSLDLRPISQGLGPTDNKPAVESASNLLGIRRLNPELGLDRPYEEVVREALQNKRAVGRETASKTTEKETFQALPAWARPEVTQSGEALSETEPPGPSTVSEGTLLDRSIEENLAESRKLLKEVQGESDLPSLLDIYEQMQAARQLEEQTEVEVAPSEESLEQTRPFTPSLGEDDKVARQRMLEKMRVYNSFISQRNEGFRDYMARGETLLKMRHYYQAAKAYERAISLEGQNPMGYLGRAYSLAGAGELVSASRSLGKALTIFPTQAQAKIDLREFFSSQEEIDRITEKLDKLAAVKEKDAGVRLLLGYIYRHSGQRSAAVLVLIEAEELAKTDPNISPELAATIAKFAKDVSR